MSQLKYLSYSCRGPSLLLQRGRAAVVPIPLSSHYDKAAAEAQNGCQSL